MSKPQQNQTKTIGTVMVIMLLGKVLGLLRERLLAVNYGSDMASYAFLTASRIPRVFFDAIFASAIAACFIPVFSEYLEKRGKKEAFEFASSFLTVMALLTGVLSVVGMALSGPFVSFLADGYNAETAALATNLTRIMFPTVLFTGIAFSFVGILQSMNRFYIPALISAVSNLVIIGYYYVFNDRFGVYGLSIAFLVGWFLQAAVQIPSLRKLGFHYRPKLDFRSEGMKKVFSLMVPVMVSTWVQPISLTINAKFASRLYDGFGVTAIELSSNLYLIIVGVFISSVTNVIFPKLSRLSADNQAQEFTQTISQAIRGSLFFILPMSAGLMVVSHPLIALVFGDGKYDAFSVAITAEGLFYLSFGMVGYALQNVLSRGCFARQDGKTPLIAGILCIGVNIALCVALTQPLGIKGLALASSISSTVYALALLMLMERGGQRLITPDLPGALVRMALATAVTAAGAYFTCLYTANLAPGKLGLVLNLGLTACVGASLYLLAALLLRLEETTIFISAFKRITKRG